MAQKSGFLHNAGNIGLFSLKTFTMRVMQCNATLYLHYDT